MSTATTQQEAAPAKPGEAVLRVVPSETHIAEDVRTIFQDVRVYMRRNRSTIVLLSAIAASVLLTRAIMRRELRALDFVVEVYPPEMPGDYGLSYAVNDGDYTP